MLGAAADRDDGITGARAGWSEKGRAQGESNRTSDGRREGIHQKSDAKIGEEGGSEGGGGRTVKRREGEAADRC